MCEGYAPYWSQDNRFPRWVFCYGCTIALRAFFVRRHKARRMRHASSSPKALTISRIRQGRARHMLGRGRPPLYAHDLDRSERSSQLPPPSRTQ